VLGVGIPAVFLILVWLWNQKGKIKLLREENNTQDVLGLNASLKKNNQEKNGLQVELINKKKYVGMDESVRYDDTADPEKGLLKQKLVNY
jgi:hypothetical protein